jgi:DNA-binding transcriptional LysR family regulator
MHIGNLHLNQLRLVDAVERNGNLGEAAEDIGLTQSAASHALSRLREELQDPIFVRTSEGMRPTPYGIRLARSVRDALESLRAGLDRHAEFEPKTSTRTFNVIMSDVSQMLYLPRLLPKLYAEAPGVTLRVRALPAKAPHLILESGLGSLAISKDCWAFLLPPVLHVPSVCSSGVSGQCGVELGHLSPLLGGRPGQAYAPRRQCPPQPVHPARPAWPCPPGRAPLLSADLQPGAQ